MSTLQSHVAGWSPEEVRSTDSMAPGPAWALHRVLGERDVSRDRSRSGVLPLLWHWLYFLEWPAHEELGPDGHPVGGAFLPPIPDRRRMFAGGRVRVTEPLETGREASRRSTLADATVKQGRSGETLFVTLRHEFHQDGRPRLVEEQDYAYRSGEPARRRMPERTRTDRPERGTEPWWSATSADPVLLFRFSALTANAHRIHYDDPYARTVEGYPGLVVHGPLLAVLMAAMAQAHGPVSEMRYRLRSPIFVNEPFAVTGGPGDGGTAGDGGAQLSVRTAPDEVNATATVTRT